MIEFISKHGVLVVAVIALIQPWLVYIYKKYLRKGKVEMYPTSNIEIGYSVFGPTVGLNGTFRCINQDMFISSINLEVTKLKDEAKHLFDWGLFKSQKITHKGEELEAELPSGIMLNLAHPRRYNIIFFDVNTKNDINGIIQKA